MNPIANHLWQSTLFAIVAGILTLALRRNRARVRHAVWMTASCKFLIPFSVLIALGGQIPWRTARVATASSVSVVMGEVSQPFTAFSTPLPIALTPKQNPFPEILFGIWLAGFLGIACSWMIRWRRIQATVRSGSPSTLIEPGVFGIFRPVLLLPEGIADHLTPTQLSAVIDHELCHIRHRDNLSAAIQMFIETVFWFHPLVWWIGKRMVEERERACDEEVLENGSEPRAYADAILNICKLYVESPLACVSGISGPNLRERIEAIMKNRTTLSLTFAKKTVLAVVAISALALPIIVGAQSQATPQWQVQAGGKKAFDVASIKPDPGAFTPPNFPLDAGDSLVNMRTHESAGGRFSADFPLSTYITFAYKLTLASEQMRAMLADLPKWVATDRFNIQARAEGNPTKDQMRLMMQSLLAERFGLKAHFEMRETNVLALILAKPGTTGPKLRPHSDGPPCDAVPDKTAYPPICDVYSMEVNQNRLRMGGSRNTTMERLAAALPSFGSLERPVVDRTGLTGEFDFSLEWTPEDPNAQPDTQETTFLQALREQLGLKLESSKAPIQTLIIDHVERPSEN